MFQIVKKARALLTLSVSAQYVSILFNAKVGLREIAEDVKPSNLGALHFRNNIS